MDMKGTLAVPKKDASKRYVYQTLHWLEFSTSDGIRNLLTTKRISEFRGSSSDFAIGAQRHVHRDDFQNCSRDARIVRSAIGNIYRKSA